MPDAKQLEIAQPAGEVESLSGGILNVIARAAADPNTDVDKLERLLAMQERVLGREAEQKFNEAMRACQAAILPVLKNKKNTETKSTYANLEAVSEAIDPVIYQHGFSLSFGSDASPLPDHYRVTCVVSHTGGYSRDYHADVPLDNTGPKGTQNKTRTHGFGSSLSYGRRYLKLLIFDVATTDDDGNAAGRGAVIDDHQWACLVTMIENVGADTKKFCQFMRVESLKEIRAQDFDKAMKALEQKAAKA
jgi:hypothetical protein